MKKSAGPGRTALLEVIGTGERADTEEEPSDAPDYFSAGLAES